jgi:hypothetical protein
MLTRFSILFLLAFGSSGAFSQANNSSLLWEISGKGLTPSETRDCVVLILFRSRKFFNVFDVVVAIGTKRKFVIGSMNENDPFGLLVPVVSPKVGRVFRLSGVSWLTGRT